MPRATNPVLSELLTGPLPAVSIAVNLRAAIVADHLGELVDHGLGTERRLALTDDVEHLRLVFGVGDGESEGVRRSAARVNEADVAVLPLRRPLPYAKSDTRLNRLSRDEALKNYEPGTKSKWELYADLLPLLNSRAVDLLEHDRLLLQLTSLERRISRAGKDSIDHPPGSHDDISNAVAGALVTVYKLPGVKNLNRKIEYGAIGIV